MNQSVVDVDDVGDGGRQDRIFHLGTGIKELVHQDELEVVGLEARLGEEGLRHLFAEIYPS